MKALRDLLLVLLLTIGVSLVFYGLPTLVVYWLFWSESDDGWAYGLAIPGGLLGLGAGMFRTESKWVPVFCGVLGLILGFFTDWRIFPFSADGSLGYYLSHLQQLRPITWIMILLGAGVAFWVPFRRLLPETETRGETEAENTR